MFRFYKYRTTKKSKYRNIKKSVLGVEFPSILQADHYKSLKLRELAKEISELELEIPFTLQPGFLDYSGKKQRPIIYRADFKYFDHKLSKYVIDETKGFKTRDYLIKKKMLLYKLPANTIFREISN